MGRASRDNRQDRKMSSYGPEFDQDLAEMRRVGLHGDAAARALADPKRYKLPPSGEELEQLTLLAIERDAFQARMGRVAGLYADVLMGWRTTAAAVRILHAGSSPTQVPLEYRKRLEGVAGTLVSTGRSRDALVLG